MLLHEHCELVLTKFVISKDFPINGPGLTARRYGDTILREAIAPPTAGQ